MSELPDKELVPGDDYQDPAGLIARQEIQEEFNTRPTDWSNWIFNQLHFRPNARILELGSGPGRMWMKNENLLKSGWHVIVSDSVTQMISEAQKNLRNLQHLFNYAVIDAQAVPFNKDFFDGVIVDGVLDVLPDLDQALSEIYRILKPGGCLVASAGGESHLKELEEIVEPFTGQAQYGRTSSQFALENGQDVLSTRFTGTIRRDYQDVLIFTEVDPVLTYALSEGNMEKVLSGKRLQRFSRAIQERLRSQGEIRVRIHKGLFEAYKPVRG